MKKYIVVFKLQLLQEKHAFSVVDDKVLKTIPKNIIFATKEIPNKEIYTKEELKSWVEELGGIWYGNN